ncbi:class II aldolase/adducin family protein [Mesorhizobium sp. M0619]|uniref:class II aldolase/adducin family protein n=1 Tax=unclassified Mesorhizobium TaxID=325217 RepID=UPI003336C4F0
MNPNQVHFSRIKASELLLIDANDPETISRPNAPDPTAWGLHGAIHRNVRHARCVMHVHSIHANAGPAGRLDPAADDQNSAIFFNRHVVDADYGGLAFEEEGERCSHLLVDPRSR